MLYAKCRYILNARGIASPPQGSFTLKDDSDGRGPYIATWDIAVLGAQPTQVGLDAVTDQEASNAASDAIARNVADVDSQRILGAFLWALLKQMYPADTDAQTKTKFGVARTRIISVFKGQPWK
jgi:hypothetical protein